MGETIQFELNGDIPKHPAGHWCNYVKAGMQGAFLEFIQPNTNHVNGCEISITGTIPQNAGLSSSSALVVASGMAALYANNMDYDSMQLAESMALAEHYVGTRGGGMDHAASLLAVPCHVMKMGFFPLLVKDFYFPEDVTVIICQSGVVAKKSAEALQQFNLRALECRLAFALLQRKIQNGEQAKRLGDLLKPPFQYAYKDVQNLIINTLYDVYTVNEMKHHLDSDARFNQLLDDYNLSNLPQDELIFSCGKRFRHIITDAMRVEWAAIALRYQDKDWLCELINEGHQSARDDFEISCPQIEALIDCARNNGALASRITGAGFGGSTINIVERENVDGFMHRMREQFYKGDQWTTMEPMIHSHPSSGAEIITD
jgi:N-acetylgalactosamine kinase